MKFSSHINKLSFGSYESRATTAGIQFTTTINHVWNVSKIMPPHLEYELAV